MQCPLLSINFSLGLPGDPTHVQLRVFFILYDSACRQPSFILSYCASVPIFLNLPFFCHSRQMAARLQYQGSTLSAIQFSLWVRFWHSNFHKLVWSIQVSYAEFFPIAVINSLSSTLLQFIAQVLLTFHLYFSVSFSVPLANFTQSDLFKVFPWRSSSETTSLTTSLSLNPPLLPFITTINCLSLLLGYFHYSQPIPPLSSSLLRCSVQPAHSTCL